MSDVRSILYDNGLGFPNYSNSNLSLFNKLASGYKDRVLFILLDGLSYDTIAEILEKSSYSFIKSGMHLERISSIAPTFTLSIINSLFSGKTVSEHGIVGNYIIDNRFGYVIRPLSKIDSNVASNVFPEVTNLKSIDSRYGLTMIVPEEITDNPYNNMLMNSFKTYKTLNEADLVTSIRNEISLVDDKRFIYAYSEFPDLMEHNYSKQSDSIKADLDSFLYLLDKYVLKDALDKGFAIFITTDHGHIAIRKDDVYTVDKDNSLLNYLYMRSWGTERIVFLNLKDNVEREFIDYYDKSLKERFLLFRSKELLDAGLFGSNINKDIIYKFGDYTLIAKGSTIFDFLEPGRNHNFPDLFGHHGGLSEEELYIPLITNE
ncbi:MAG: nucleotide pyrophosphatase [Candidatus Micrarchaeota archaeon]|nr:MAG: nucleotide pyrophosphatase [Candidatus Micrarchaeota archaeon]